MQRRRFLIRTGLILGAGVIAAEDVAVNAGPDHGSGAAPLDDASHNFRSVALANEKGVDRHNILICRRRDPALEITPGKSRCRNSFAIEG